MVRLAHRGPFHHSPSNPFDDVTPVISGNNVVYDGFSGRQQRHLLVQLRHWLRHSHSRQTLRPSPTRPSTTTWSRGWSSPSTPSRLTCRPPSSAALSSRPRAPCPTSSARGSRADLITYVLDYDVGWYDHGTGQTVRLTQDAHVQNMAVPSGNYIYFTDNRTGKRPALRAPGRQRRDLPADRQRGVALGLDDADGQTVVYNDQRYGNVEVFRLTWWQFDLPPIADAGEDQTVDGGRGGAVGIRFRVRMIPTWPGLITSRYHWSHESQAPGGSTAQLSDPQEV